MPTTRRRFIAATAACLATPAAAALLQAAEPPKFRIRTLTSGPKHHFFGYYGIPPWNQSSKLMVCLETDFQDRMPTASDAARVGLVDPESGKFTALAETHSWNPQQGCMLHWNPLQPEDEILYNDRRADQPITVALNVQTGKRRTWAGHISGAARKAGFALGLNYARSQRLRPTVGYQGLSDAGTDALHPDDDGIRLVDLATGQSRLIVSVGECYRRLVDRNPVLKELPIWLDHTVFSRDDARFLFLARAYVPGRPGGKLKRELASAMFTCNRDGSELREVISFRVKVSHFDWRDATRIVAAINVDGPKVKHVLFTDGKDDMHVLAEDFLYDDGHCHFAPDGRWLVSDPYDFSISGRQLLLYNVATDERIKLGGFTLKPYVGGDTRCDLHPRFSRDGRTICFDAIEQQAGTRQLHLAHLDFLPA